MSNAKCEVMPSGDLQNAFDLAREEGWNPGLHDAQTFYSLDPKWFLSNQNQRSSDCHRLCN